MGWKQAPGSVKDQGLLSTEMVDTHAQILLIRSRKGYSVRVLWAARLLTVSAEARKSMSKSDLQLCASKSQRMVSRTPMGCESAKSASAHRRMGRE